MIVYTGRDEVLVCDNNSEKKFLKDYFKEGGRNLEDYDRDVTVTMRIGSRFVVVTDRSH